MSPNAWTASADRVLRQLPLWTVLLLALLLLFCIGVLDYVFGLAISLSFFYILPVGIATWYGNREMGVLCAVLTDLPMLAEQAGRDYSAHRPGVLLWTLFLQTGTMLVVVALLARIRALLRHEAALARTDPLTGLLNRRGFIERLDYLVHLAAREDIGFALAYIDIDDFKEINDRYGHEEGDRALRVTSKVLMTATRHSDVAGRLGGDEFALLLPGLDRDKAAFLMHELHELFRLTFQGERLALTCSIGCVAFGAVIPDVAAAIRAADALMYEVKRRGKDSVCVKDYGASESAACD
jgi:diguanylate cyclase (GGDEF)-like protein